MQLFLQDEAPDTVRLSGPLQDFLGIAKFTFPSVQMTGDDTVGCNRLTVALHVSVQHLRLSLTAAECLLMCHQVGIETMLII